MRRDGRPWDGPRTGIPSRCGSPPEPLAGSHAGNRSLPSVSGVSSLGDPFVVVTPRPGSSRSLAGPMLNFSTNNLRVTPTEMQPDRTVELSRLMRERILVLDGAMGTMIQQCRLTERDFRGPFHDHPHDLAGDNDLLSVTRPDTVEAIHDAYLAAGADLIETNTFSATRIAQSDYQMESQVRAINESAARIARRCADRWSARTPDRPRFVAGALGPTNRTASISPDVNDPGARNVTYDALVD